MWGALVVLCAIGAFIWLIIQNTALETKEAEKNENELVEDLLQHGGKRRNRRKGESCQAELIQTTDLSNFELYV